MAENWHFYAFVVLVLAAFGFVYLNSSSLSSDDFSAKGYVCGRVKICSASAPSYHPPSGSISTSCSGCTSGSACCTNSGGTITGYWHDDRSGNDYTKCSLGQYKGHCGSGGCAFGSAGASATPSATPRSPLVTARPTLTVRTTATPSPTSSLNTTGCGGNSRCSAVCATGYYCSGALAGACGGRCVRTVSTTVPSGQ